MKVKHNTKGLENLLKSINKIKEVELAIGVFRDAGKNSGAKIHNAALLAIHELSDGSKFPARPVMKVSTQQYGVSWGISATKAMSSVLRKSNGRVTTYPTIINALNRTGVTAVSNVKAVFGSPSLTRNAPATIEAKGFNAPLVESGELEKSIKFKSRRKGTK
jgi:hypothetical protein